MKDYYAILDIDPTATAHDIKAQHRLMIKKWQPGLFASRQIKAIANANAKEIDEAYEVLSNPAKRADYDGPTGRTTLGNVLTLAPDVEIKVVLILAGEFLMGSADEDKDTQSREKPQHNVTLDEYLIGKYPVTNAQFAAFVNATGYMTTAEQLGSGYSCNGDNWAHMLGADWRHPMGPNSDLNDKKDHPVVLVSWDDAMAFCAWVSQVTGRKVTLPTEAQWEKAARGIDERVYPWGNKAPNAKLANHNNNVNDTTAVGKYSPAGDSPYGLADMAGNVWEWTADWYDGNYYASSPASNPQGPTTGSGRVVRGGSWYDDSYLTRGAGRIGGSPSKRSVNLGFRVAVSALGQSDSQEETDRIARERRAEADRQVKRKAQEESERLERERQQEQYRQDALRKAAEEPARRPPQEANLDLTPVVLTLSRDVTIQFVRILAGAFLMGITDDDTKYPDENPQHNVTLDEYLIGKYDVTNAQYAVYAKAKGLRWSMPQGKENHPVVSVSWNDAVAFCAWASQFTGRKVTLPTEAQWEKAARGTDGRIYPWGNEAPNANLANFSMNVKDTTEVGKYSPAGDSPYGLSDMAGNVWQWIADWYSETYYASSPASNPQGPTKGQYRALRGGSWDDSSIGIRTTYRGSYFPNNRLVNFGFRVVVSVPAP